jgi:hypothetical protein
LIAALDRAAARGGQRGWIGLVGLLLALVIVAVLAQKVLRTYGLLSASDTGTKSATERGVPSPGGASSTPMDPTMATPTPRAAIERAKGVEDTVLQQARDMNKKIDDEAK